MRKEFNNLTELIKNNLDTPETKECLELINKLKDVKQKGFFTKEQFLDVVRWKSPRPEKHYLSNSEESVVETSRKMLSTDSEDLKMSILDSLNGVSIAVAFSLLTIVDPKNYGIIDIRVWQLLHKYDEVKTKPGGQGFNLDDWKLYLSILKKYASQFNVTVRDIERILFEHHKEVQEGLLYKN